VKTILYVTENLPAAVSGASVATMGTLRALRRGGWGVHLVLNVRRGEDEKLGIARELSTTFTPVRRPRMRIPPIGGWLATLGRLGYAPRWQPEMWRAVDAALRGGGIDLVLLDHIRVAEYGRLAKEAGHRVPIALREHNVEHELNARIAPEMDRRWERLETRLRAHRYRAIETHLARYCDLVLPISEVDGAKLAALNPGLPSVAFPSPVDTDHYTPAAGPPAGKEIVFVGGMGYGPNRDAVTWFVKEVLPAVRARHPDVRFTAVGEKPPEWFAEHAPHVQGVGFVPDERVYVKRGRVFVAPIRYGSGVRTKILNALAMRRPVVATTIGAEGLHLAPGRAILIEDDAGRFAEAVNTVLADDARAASLAEEGLKAVLATYAPEAVAASLRAAVARVGV
jgi:glycosyltransferase involved in cell wall biosynthesis